MAKKKLGKKAASGSIAKTLRQYAVDGAHAAMARLRQEMEVIERTFPELSTASGRKSIVAGVEESASRMSAAGRKSVSLRMKKYWAARRKTAAAKPKK